MSIGAEGQLVEGASAKIIERAEATGLRGFVTTFDMTAETAKGAGTWKRPEFLMK